MSCKALEETPILVEALAAAIGTSAEDACHSLVEYDRGPRATGIMAGRGLTAMLHDLVATG